MFIKRIDPHAYYGFAQTPLVIAAALALFQIFPLTRVGASETRSKEGSDVSIGWVECVTPPVLRADPQNPATFERMVISDAVEWAGTKESPVGRFLKARAEVDVTLYQQLLTNHRLTAEVLLAAADRPILLSWTSADRVDRLIVRVWGDQSERGLIHFEHTPSGQLDDEAPDSISADYRLWPSVENWSRDEEERGVYAKEFEDSPGWDEHWLRLSLDVAPSETRVWVDGRMLWSLHRAKETRSDFELTLQPGDKLRSVEIVPLPEREFLPIDLAPYHNNNALNEGDLGDGYSFSGLSLQNESVISVSGIPFQVRWSGSEENNCDLGRTEYRSLESSEDAFRSMSMPYLHCDALSSDPKRMLVRVPKRYYDRAHLICVSDTQDGETPSAALRMIKTGRGHAVSRDFNVPHWNDSTGVGRPLDAGRMAREGQPSEENGRLWQVSVPLNPAAFQDFLGSKEETCLELDFTRLVGLDTDKFPRPMGPPSAVHLFALTLEEAPAEMLVTSDAVGHIFERPTKPVFRVQLKSQRDEPSQFNLGISVEGPNGFQSHQERDLILAPRETRVELCELPDGQMGKFDVTFTLSLKGGNRTLERTTSYAVLPQYERTASEENPFGIWCFFEFHFGAGPEIAAPLMRLAGARWTLSRFLFSKNPEENADRLETMTQNGVRPNFDVLCGIGNSPYKGLGDIERRFAEIESQPCVRHYNVFWETVLSRRTRDMIPPELLGRPPLDLTDEEREKIRKCWEMGTTYSRRARKEYPDLNLVFGNGFPFFIGAMLRDGYPKELIDGFGLDFDLYTAMPERQPGIIYAPFTGLYFLKKLQETYGCEEKPRYLTEAIYAPAAPGWLTERQQADYYVRTHLLAMATGVKYFGMCTEIWDPGGWFGYGHYGPVGLCHRPPELNPRESFCAYSTMTGKLNDAQYESTVNLGSPSAYGLRFKRRSGGTIHAFWTIRGSRPVVLSLERDAEVRITDRFGNTSVHASENQELRFAIDGSPIYLEDLPDLVTARLGESEHEDVPESTTAIVDFSSLEGWERSAEPYEWSEGINENAPLVECELPLESVRTGPLSQPALRVGVTDSGEVHPIETQYDALVRTGSPIEIPETAVGIGACIHGNSSWGRVLFELTDAHGNRWLSARAEVPIDFDGYRYVETELPHAPAGRDVEPTGYRPWVHKGGDSAPTYPCALTRLIFEARSHVIRGGEIEPVTMPDYYVDRIMLRHKQSGGK